MTRRQYRNRWLMYHGRYERRGLRIFTKSIKKAALSIPFDKLTKYSYQAAVVITVEQIEDAYVDFYTTIGLMHGKRVGREVNKELKRFSIDFFDPFFRKGLRAWLAENAGVRITTVRQGLIKYLIDFIGLKIEEGMTLDEVGREVKKHILSRGFYRWQIERIVRTETTAAANYGASIAGDVSGVLLVKEWVSSNDGRTRRHERQDLYDHIDMDAVRVPKHDFFDVPDRFGGSDRILFPGDPKGKPGNVINCFTGDTLVSFDSLKKAIRSIYTGKIITIETSRGYKLSGTPNHPVLTANGFIRLDQVNHSTSLICCPLERKITRGFNVDNVPTSFKKLYDSLSVFGMRMRVGSIPVNLYGNISNRNVNVIKVNSFLFNNRVSIIAKIIRKIIFEKPYFALALFFFNGLFNTGLYKKIFRLVSNSLISCFSYLFSILNGCFLKPNYIGFAPGSFFDVGIPQNPRNSSSSNTKTVGYRKFRFATNISRNNILFKRPNASVPVQSNPRGFKPPNNNPLADPYRSSDIIGTLSRHVHFDNPINIKTDFFHDIEVYTLETKEQIYNSGGVIAKNCRCTVGLVPQRDANGDLIFL